MVVHMGEKEDSTHLWAAIDRGIGRMIKMLTEEVQQLWLTSSRENILEWNAQKMSCSRRRILMTQWVGAAWRKYCAKYRKSHEKCCKRSGLLVALDDFDIDEIRIEGVPTYRASQNVDLDDSERAHFKELVSQHVMPKKVDLWEISCFCF